jgi:hypothetical protein
VLSKLFGVSFNLDLDVNDVDEFFIEQLYKMLRFWNCFRMPLAKMIVNLILTSMLWFFITIWGGSKKNIKKCKTLLKNF